LRNIVGVGDGEGGTNVNRGFLVLVSAVLAGTTWAADDDEDEKPKYTIKQVMKKTNKEGLLKKVVKGKATQDDKSRLLELYKSLEKNRPPKGTKKEWEARTKPIIAAAQDVVDGKQGAGKRLANAVSCLDCHQAHVK
jgi:hypothetical protein